MREKRSLLYFGILLFVVAATAIFITNEAEKAIAEIEELQNMPVYLGRKE